MLSKLASFIESKPKSVIAFIILLTLVFASFIPSLKMGTSTRDFMPNNEMVRASDRINEYFGKNVEPVMIIFHHGMDGNEIKNQYLLMKNIEKIEGVEGCVGVATFVASLCGMEYQKNLLDCSNDEIMAAYNDLMSQQKEIDIEDASDVKYDFADITHASMKADEKNLNITITVKNLDVPRFMGVEWFISFKNAVDPARLNFTYTISARWQRQWCIGEGIKNNIENLGNSMAAYLWMGKNGKYFDVKLNATIILNKVSNSIIMIIPREEIGKYGIAPSFGNASLPAKLYDIKVGSRVSMPVPFSVSSTLLGNLIKYIERIFIANFINRWLPTNLSMVEDLLMKKDSISFSDFSMAWKDIDNATIEGTFLIKQPFMNDMRNSALAFLSFDGNKIKASLMIAQVNGSMSMEAMKKTSKKIVDMVKQNDKTAEITGSTVISYQIDELTGKSNRVIMPSIFIAIIIILFINFRRPTYVFLSIAGLSIAIIWLFGTMSILGIKFNTLAVALVPLLMGLGVDYSVHIFHNYLNEIRNGKSVRDAIRVAIREVGLALILATITTAVSFLSFLTASVPSVRDFGILAAIGIFYTFIIAITLEAAARYIMDRGKEIRAEKSKSRFSVGRIMASLSDFICSNPIKVLVAIILVTGVMAAAASHVTTSFSLEEFMPKESPAIKAMEKLPKYFPSAGEDQEYILVEGNVATLDALKGVKETMEKLGDDSFVAKLPDGSMKVSSIYTIIQKALKENGSIAEKFHFENGLPESDKDVKALYDWLYESSEYGRDVKSVLHKNGDSYDATLIRVYTTLTHLENSNEKMKKLYTELEGDLADYGNAKATITGSMVLIYNVMKSLTESQLNSTIICILIAALVIMIAYRKPILGAFTLLPVVISSIWIMGTIYLAGYSLNVMTVMITSLTIGLGITYAIHVVERFRLIADRTGDVMKAVEEAVANTGQAVMMAALTTIAGFAILIFSPMPPEQQFGFITAMTIIYSFITTILVMPPLLLLWGKWRKRKKGYIISPDKPSDSP